jgi:flagellar hook-length control protein FliK
MPQATTVATADAVAADTTPDRLRDPVGSAKWADALGARLMLMATRGEQQGSLRLSPEHLGPLEVQIRVQDDKATVWFGAQHADTRAALQDALPRLREMFVSSGMQLGDAGVSREAPRQDRTPAEFLSPGTVGENGTAEELSLPAAAASAVHVGLLDTYA